MLKQINMILALSTLVTTGYISPVLPPPVPLTGGSAPGLSESLRLLGVSVWETVCASGRTAYALGAGTVNLAYNTGVGIHGMFASIGNGMHTVSSTIVACAEASPALTGVVGVTLAAATVYALYRAVKFGASPKVAAWFALQDGRTHVRTDTVTHLTTRHVE